jgi:hypothetical protein
VETTIVVVYVRYYWDLELVMSLNEYILYSNEYLLLLVLVLELVLYPGTLLNFSSYVIQIQTCKLN